MTAHARLPIVAYHSIDELGTRISVSPARFEAQMRWFGDHGWRTLGLRESMQMLLDGRWIEPRHFVLTFDDGMASLLTSAAPLLEELGFVAATFIITGQVGQCPDFYRLPDEYRRSPLLDIDGLKSLARMGWEIHPHTQDHPVLPHLPLAVQVDQIRRSREFVEEHFNAPGNVLAYPFGQFNDDTLRAMRQCDMLAGLTLQFGTGHGRTADQLTRPRVGSAWFKGSAFRQRLAVTGWMDRYVALRIGVRGDRKDRYFSTPTRETTCGLTAGSES